MSVYTDISRIFEVNWTTILVGWEGLGVFSPWPGRWCEFPSLLSPGEISEYGNERLSSSSDQQERTLIENLIERDLPTETRETIRNLLRPLSELHGGDPSIEIRKWRLVMLEELSRALPQDPLYGLLAFSDFWQSFGFPADSPHEVQGRGNSIAPQAYYQKSNLERAVDRHLVWIEREKAAIIGKPSG